MLFRSQARDAHASALTLLERHRSAAGDNSRRLAGAYDNLRSVQAELQGLLSVLRNDLEVKTAGLQERRQFLESRLAEIDNRLAADVDARNAAAERRRGVERQLAALERLAALVEGHASTLDVRQGELQEIRRRQSDEVRAISQRLDEARKERSTNEQLQIGRAHV